MIYTIYGQPFKDWVNQHIQARHEKFANKRNLLIDMDPEIAQALGQTTMVSSKFFPNSNLVTST